MKARRILGIVLTVMMLIGFAFAALATESEITVLLDGEKLEFDVPPQLINDRTMVPMRKIFESMGAQVEWEEGTETVTATKGDITVIMQIDNTVITVNGEEITLDVPPQLVDSRTLVPARAVAESLEATVEWDEENSTVIITSKVEETEAEETEESEEVDIYINSDPTIDFTNDDGLMSMLHYSLRFNFQRNDFPNKLYKNKDVLKKSIVKNPEKFLEFIENEVWEKCMKSISIQYIRHFEEMNVVLSDEESIDAIVNEFADKYSLHAHQNYKVDTVLSADGEYLFLLTMADIYDGLTIDESGKVRISNYIGVVYNSTSDEFGYYLMGRSQSGEYELCSIDDEEKLSELGSINYDTDEFVEKIREDFFDTDKKVEEVDIYSIPKPTIDISDYDEEIIELFKSTRCEFEKRLPVELYTNPRCESLVSESHGQFLRDIDRMWVSYLYHYYEISMSDDKYIFMDDFYKFMEENCLAPHQNYTVDIIQLTDDQYLFLFNMADMYDNLKRNDIKFPVMNSYIGILYNSKLSIFDYYFLENNGYEKCKFGSINEKGERTYCGTINNDKKEFVENIKQINGID